jgi:hypothetical protein
MGLGTPAVGETDIGVGFADTVFPSTPKMTRFCVQ